MYRSSTLDRATLRLAIYLSPNTFLLEPRENQLRLPETDISYKQRDAPQIRWALEQRWGRRCVVVDVFGSLVAVSCIATSTDQKHEGLVPCDPARLLECLTDEQERSFISGMLSPESSPERPFGRFEWVAQFLDWATVAVQSNRGQIERTLTQWNGNAAFSLLRFANDQGEVLWFKATGSPNRHERTVHQALFAVDPNHVPFIVAVHERWNGWLMEDAGDPLSERHSAEDYLRGISELLQLQASTADSAETLSLAGCADHRVLSRRLPRLMAYLDDIMSQQTVTHVPRVPRVPTERLIEIENVLAKALREYDEIPLPAVINHGDLNEGNVLIRKDHIRFCDWAEGIVGCPLISFETFRRLACQGANSKILDGPLRRSFLDVFDLPMSEQETRRAFELAVPAAIVSRLCGRNDFLSSEHRFDPIVASYSRSLGRHLDAAVRELSAI